MKVVTPRYRGRNYQAVALVALVVLALFWPLRKCETPPLRPGPASALLARLAAAAVGARVHPVCDAATLTRELTHAGRAVAPRRAESGRGSATAAVVCIIGSVPAASVAAKLWELGSRLFPPQFVSEFEATFDDLDRNFLAPFHLDHVLLFQRGAGLDCALLAAARRLGWLDAPQAAGGVLVGGNDVLLPCLLGASVCADSDLWTPRGTRVRLRARDFALPIYLQRDPSLLDAPGWRECEGQKWSLGYVLYSGAAYAHHVYTDELLATYDYTFKVDADVRFRRRPPVDPVAVMREQRCVLAHTEVVPGSSHASCQHGAFAALTQFSKKSGSPIASADYSWCSQSHGPDYFYGNLMGGASSFLRSEANTLLNLWLYECDEGFFRSRWGDQVSPTLYLCHWLDIPSLNKSDVSNVCDFSNWRRDGVFEHGKEVL